MVGKYRLVGEVINKFMHMATSAMAVPLMARYSPPWRLGVAVSVAIAIFQNLAVAVAVAVAIFQNLAVAVAHSMTQFTNITGLVK